MKSVLKNKKAQASDSIVWVIATLAIISILLVSIFAASVFAGGKEILSTGVVTLHVGKAAAWIAEIFFYDPEKPDLILVKNILTYVGKEYNLEEDEFKLKENLFFYPRESLKNFEVAGSKIKFEMKG